MKICFIALRDFKVFPRASNEVETLVRNGHDIEIIAFDQYIKSSTCERHGEVKITTVRPIFWIDSGTLNIFDFFPAFAALFSEALKKKADAYHCYDVVSLVVGFLVKIILGRKLIYDAYEIWPNLVSNAPNFKPVSKVTWTAMTFFENLMASFAEHILTIPTVENELFNRFRRVNKNVTVLANFPKLDFPVDNKRRNRLKSKYRNNRVVFYIGAISKEKGVLKCIEAINIVKKIIPNIKLLMTEGFYENDKEEIMSYIKERKLHNHIEFIRLIPYDQLLDYLSVAEIGLMLYQPESSLLYKQSLASLKPFIFMFSSTPVLMSNSLPISKMIRKERCGILVNPLDPAEIAEVIANLLENPKEAREMGRRGKEAVEKKYNWKIMEEKLIKAYNE